MIPRSAAIEELLVDRVRLSKVRRPLHRRGVDVPYSDGDAISGGQRRQSAGAPRAQDQVRQTRGGERGSEARRGGVSASPDAHDDRARQLGERHRPPARLGQPHARGDHARRRDRVLRHRGSAFDERRACERQPIHQGEAARRRLHRSRLGPVPLRRAGRRTGATRLPRWRAFVATPQSSGSRSRRKRRPRSGGCSTPSRARCSSR